MKFVGVMLVLIFAARIIMALADHFVYLPYAPNTPLMQQTIKTQNYNYCLDSRAASYPNFVTQTNDVVNEYAKRTGIIGHTVNYEDPNCNVQYLMLPEFPCGAGAAACVYYLNWPVQIHFNEVLGYTDWRSAIGHELGHALLGLHEQYHDQGNITCTYRTDTVMDCGSQVKYPQTLDVTRGCALIQTSWCGQDATVVICYGAVVSWGNNVTAQWNACSGRWEGSNGYAYEPSTGYWYQGTIDWSPCRSWGGRDSVALQGSDYGGSGWYNWQYQMWVVPPSC